MEQIIRGPVIASETRKLNKPAINRGGKADAAVGGSAASQSMTPQFAEENNPRTEQVSADASSAKPPSSEQSSEEFVAQEKSLAEAQALAEKRGFAVGLQKGEEAGKNSVAEQIERLSSIAASLYQAKAIVLESGEDALVEIAYTAVCQIVGTKAVLPSVIADTVKRVTALVKERDRLTVRLHPDDFELMQKIPRPAGVSSAEEQISLQPDTGVQLGGCIVDSSKGSLDARLDLQLDRLREILIEARNAREQSEESV